jgi:transposase
VKVLRWKAHVLSTARWQRIKALPPGLQYHVHQQRLRHFRWFG